jgi:phosphoribosylaminoimidazolecarboxamide formyltransferase/IMP cyclohydrolase
VVAVVADRPGIAALDRAVEAKAEPVVVRLGDHRSPDGTVDRAAWDAALADAVAAFAPDLVVSAGFMKVLGPAFLARFGGRTVNTHPALLPAFPGAHGVADALAHGVKVTGATVHLVDAGVDTGPVLAQQAVVVDPDDTQETLHERIKVVERRMLVETVAALVRHGATITGRTVRIAVTAAPQTAPTGQGTEGRRPIRRALVSVFDKAGLLDLATGLHAAGVEVVSTGSTASRIADAGVPVTRVEELTGFPECLDGRVKTLHPRVHAGLLADSRLPTHVDQLESLGIAPFDLLVSNLYPFTQTVASGASPDDCVEQIDIGGPAMLRAAAKNHETVAVVTDPSRYAWVLAEAQAGGVTRADRQALAAEAFRHTASYDVAVASWMGNVLAPDPATSSDGTSVPFPGWVGTTARRRAVLRYGENPHQAAALYAAPEATGGIAGAVQLHGKEMSYNNYVDADAAWRAAHDHGSDQVCVAIIKHANPCGIAVGTLRGERSDGGDDVADTHARAHACDPTSAFGGVIAVNAEVTVAAAEQIAEIFTEVVVAPRYADGAVDVLARKKNIRVLTAEWAPAAAEQRPISGGLLVQQRDAVDAPGDDPSSWTLATGSAVPEETLADLAFAWRACRAVKSNAILLAHDGATVGVGMGQVNRVDSARLAVARAGDRVRGSVAASDAFFPFPDGFEVLAEAGVAAVVQPGGSVRDNLTIEAAEKAGVAMYLTGTRHFAH